MATTDRERTLPDEGREAHDLSHRPIGYVLGTFPQLSETFIENELWALQAAGQSVVALSLYRPHADIVGPTTLDARLLEYRPSPGTVAREFARWTLRRPFATARNVWRALYLRSQNMLRGAWLAGWVATRLRAADARHVHAHFGHDPACVGLAAAGLARLPFTFTVHAHDIYLRNRGLGLRARKADRVITVCEYNVDQLLQRCPGLARSHISIVYCGVDPSMFVAAENHPRNGVPRVLSVGRLVAQKGFDVLITAVQELAVQGVEVDCEIAGRGPLLDELEALAKELGIESSVRFSGALLPPDVSERMARCDVFVLACRIDSTGNRDSMPVVIKEAMAAGVPVVSTDTVGIPEMVDAMVGRLVPPDDAPSLARAIGELLALPESERHALGLAGRRRVEERFNLHIETAKLRAIFDELDS